MEKLHMQTTNIVDENIRRIGEFFPNCHTERLDENGKPEVAIDLDQLRQELSKDIVKGPEERYQFTWPDRQIARQHSYYFVLRNSCFATDNEADNFEQIWKEYSKDTIRRIM